MGIVLALWLAAAAAAPQAEQNPGPAEAVAGTGQSAAVDTTKTEPEIDPSKLGVSLSRIRRGLRQSETREVATGDPMRLEYQVQVYGAAPRIDIIGDFDIGQGAPLSYGAPTHGEFLRHWTPEAYRSPPVPFSSIASWALFKLVKRNEKSKCEQEIAEYRAMVMQGIAVSAPRCTQ